MWPQCVDAGCFVDIQQALAFIISDSQVPDVVLSIRTECRAPKSMKPRLMAAKSKASGLVDLTPVSAKCGMVGYSYTYDRDVVKVHAGLKKARKASRLKSSSTWRTQRVSEEPVETISNTNVVG